MATKNGEKLLCEEESYIIRGACFELYKKFGGAFKESVIHHALIEELKAHALRVETQKRINITHRGKKVGVYIPDLVINDCILIELKTKTFLTNDDERQFWYYLRGTNYELGFLINFGPQKLEIKRRIYQNARQQHPR